MKMFTYMIVSSLAGSLSLLGTEQASAKVFSYEKEEKIAKRLEEIKEVILDYDNTCASGCLYKLSHIKEIKLAEKVSDDHYFTWDHVDSVKDSMNFSEVIVTNSSNGEVHIKSGTPDEKKISELREQTNLPYKSLGGESEANWNLKEEFDENGNFTATNVKYTSKVVSSSPLVHIFGGVVKGVMSKSANEMFDNLKL